MDQTFDYFSAVEDPKKYIQAYVRDNPSSLRKLVHRLERNRTGPGRK